MANAFYQVPPPTNEPILNYRSGSPERKALKAALAAYKNEVHDLPMYINGEWVSTSNKVEIHPHFLCFNNECSTFIHAPPAFRVMVHHLLSMAKKS